LLRFCSASQGSRDIYVRKDEDQFKQT
jgi:hypothetical protein